MRDRERMEGEGEAGTPHAVLAPPPRLINARMSPVFFPRRTAGHKGIHPGVELRESFKPISHKCHLFEVAFVWQLIIKNTHLPLGCLQGGFGPHLAETRSFIGINPLCPYANAYRRASVLSTSGLFQKSLGSTLCGST